MSLASPTALHRADDLRVGGQFGIGRAGVARGVVRATRLAAPCALLRPGRRRRPAAEGGGQALRARRWRRDQRQRAVLGGVEGLDVEADDLCVLGP